MQAAINASIANSSGGKVEQVYIPTPDASKGWKDYTKYYAKDFSEPSTYICFSATVEESAGCSYCMDENDSVFLKKFNSGQAQPCSEDEFEMIMSKFEDVIAEKQPFLSMDPSQVLTFKELAPSITDQINDAENDPSNPEFLLTLIHSYKTKNKSRKSNIVSFKQYGEAIYAHWKQCKIERKGKSITAILKFEDSDKDDGDPYVCFRRREVRQVRKTRRTDTLSSEKLRKLLSEMESAKRLMEMVAHRETMRKEALQLEIDIFDSRCKMKSLKRTLNIKGDDEDLVTHKKRKVAIPVKAVEVPKPVAVAHDPQPAAEPPAVVSAIQPAIQQVPPNVRLPPSKIPDMDLVSLEQIAHDKDNSIKAAVKEKLRARTLVDKDWVNVTDNPYIPFCDYFDTDETSRNALNIIQPRHAAFSSIATAYPPTPDTFLTLPLASGRTANSRLNSNSYVMTTEFEDGDMKVMSVASGKEGPWPEDGRKIPRGSSLSLRKRVGRGGRIMVDRKGVVRRPISLDRIYDGTPTQDRDELSNWEHLQTFNSNSTDTVHETCELRSRVERLDDRYKYDSDVHFDNADYPGSDPSRLNGIAGETQSIRFGSILMSKAYDSYWDAYKQRQQQLSMMQKILQQHQQKQQRQQLQSSVTSNTKPLTSQTDQTTPRNHYQPAYPQQSVQQPTPSAQPLNGLQKPNIPMLNGHAPGMPQVRSPINQSQRAMGYDAMNTNNKIPVASAATAAAVATAPASQYGVINKSSLIGMNL